MAEKGEKVHMTGFKCILVPMYDAETGGRALEGACSLGKPYASHIVALHVRLDLSPLAPLGIAEMMPATEAAAARRAAATKDAFDRICRAHAVEIATAPPGPEGLSAQWIERIGGEDNLVARYGRLADLVVVEGPSNARGNEAILDVALRETGRPLLLTPRALPTRLGQRIAVAWNASAEAARAAAAALPLLGLADAVTVLVVEEHEGRSITDGEELVGYLAWHGIRAHAQVAKANGRHAGELLLAEAERCGADLLVMGAYAHRSLRQLVAGGVTHHVLHHSSMPALLCH